MSLASAINTEVSAQTTADSTDFAFLPAISFNSDLGFMGGGLFNWYVYKENQFPFYRYVSLAAIATTKGLLSFSLMVDKPYAFNTKMRMTYEVYSSRFVQDSYFGVGNYSYDAQKLNPGIDDYYLFKTFTSGAGIKLRYPITISEKGSQIDLKGGLEIKYETPWGNDNTQLIMQSPPPGVDGTHTVLFETGLIWENRNNEFRTTKGTYAEFTVQTANKIWGSAGNVLRLEQDLRSFLTFHVIKDITLANRLFITHTSGDVPYWQMAYAGDEDTMRGYTARRFLDDNVFILNSELRTWLFELPMLDSEFGGTLFIDAGRTFSNSTPLKDAINDTRFTAGFGAVASFFTPNFIIRADVGFSEEGTGIYFTTGYMF